ncbi:MAG: transcriptional regulator, partial [Halapricum sp.]
MVQCEMCGKETNSPNTVKIEGAELEVCDECTEFGTEVKTQQGSSTSTKYSTGSSSSSSSSSSGSSSQSASSSSGGSSSSRRRDMFDEMDEIAQDYDERIRSGREAAGLSQEELAKQLNEKASLIRKL